MKKTIICTTCPNGCEITAEYTDRKDFSIEGNRCSRGYEFTLNECFEPKRMFTASVRLKDAYRKMLPLRSDIPVPKELLIEIAKHIKDIEVNAPVDSRQIIVKNVLGTGADLVSSMRVEANSKEAAK